MEILTTFVPPILVFAVVLSAPLFHGFLAAGQAVARLTGNVRAQALS